MKKQNKVRNIGVLFEALNNNVVKSIDEGDNKLASNYFRILKKYFLDENSELKKAYKIHSQILYGECTNAFYAVRYMNYVLKESLSGIDFLKLNEEISLMLKEITAFTSVKKTFSTKIQNYKLYASFQNLLEEKRHNQILRSSERIQCEETIINHLLENPESSKLKKSMSLVEYKEDDQHNQVMNEYVFLFALKEFKRQYKYALTETQKECLYKYLSSPSTRSYNRWLEKKINNLVEDIHTYKSNVDSEEIQEKLEMVSEKLKGFNEVEDKMQNLTDILLTFEAVEQLKNLGEK
jgi:hypothetical protein